MYTVDQVAERLGLHVRTVRNYVRDGRLKAVRIGKQYRIARADLETFTGSPAPQPQRTRHVEVSTIVEVDAIGRAEADRVSTMVLASVSHRGDGGRLGRVETVYDQERERMKIVILADLATTATLLRLIGALVEEER